MGPVLITLYLEGWVMEALCCKCTLRCTSFRTWYFKCYYNQMLVTVQNMLIFHKHYHYSPKALRELKSIAKSLEKKDTRCVPHISKAAKCVLENYTVILSYSEHVSQSKATTEVVGRGLFIANKMRDYRVLQYMFFMDDLEIIRNLCLNLKKWINIHWFLGCISSAVSWINFNQAELFNNLLILLSRMTNLITKTLD